MQLDRGQKCLDLQTTNFCHKQKVDRRDKKQKRQKRDSSPIFQPSISSRQALRVYKQQKNKKYNEEHRHQSYSSSSSPSSSHSSKNQKKSVLDRSRNKQTLIEMRTKCHLRDEQNQETHGHIKRKKINGSFLSTLILQQKFQNRKLDEKDIANAGQKLQTKFQEVRTPVTMSQYLSSQTLKPISTKKLQAKKYICELQRCKRQFFALDQFEKHLQKHRELI